MSLNQNRPLISVVIPTFNRAKLLKLALNSLTIQTIEKQKFEVIVVNDGSTDDTIQICEQFSGQINLKYFTISNSGISAAKNLGLFASTAPICFFFDDDDVADRNLLAEHIKTHTKYPDESVAVLGYTTWSSRIKVSFLMDYVINIGYDLFYYKNLEHEESLYYTFFWGGRSSCKKNFLIKHGVFNQGFRFGSEDIELGYRLKKHGLRVIYNKNAKSYMVRPITFEQFINRKKKQGKSLDLFLRLHPTDEVREYAKVQNAKKKIEYINEYFEDNIKRVKYLESLLLSKITNEEAVTIKNNLISLYSWVFEASKIKGYLEEFEIQEAKIKKDFDLVTSKYISSDLQYLNNKFLNTFKKQNFKKNILIIDPSLPMYDRASGSLRLFQIIKALVELKFHITFISQNDIYAGQYVPQLIEMGVEVYAGDPHALHDKSENHIMPKLNMANILSNREYSVAILSFWEVGKYYEPQIRKYSPNTKIIVDSVDIHFIRELRQAELKKDLQLFEKVKRRKIEELKTYTKADEVWVITEYDKSVLEKNGVDNSIKIIPNIHNIVTAEKNYKLTKDLLFVGNFWHLPNIDAIKYFHEEVFPKVKLQIPDIKLYIVGNHPTPEIKKMQSKDVIVTGYVEKIEPYLQEARISIAPLRFGAGMKGKVGEALSWGLPVVTTTIGAEGMELTNGENVIIADEANKIANEIIRLYNDENLWNKLSNNGKIHVESNWSYSAILKKLKMNFILHISISIIIPTYNNLDYTKQTIESIQKYTQDKYEIIIVDNASTDNTIKEFESYKDVKVVSNKENLGFPKAVNKGILEAQGNYVLIANNDIVVTEGWLERMVEIAKKHPEVGIVGPISNSVSGRQFDKDAKYESIEDMHKYAKKVKEKRKGEFFEFPRVAFLCTLIKKEVIDKIGGLDERFSPGNFEDDDFCLRAQMAGYKTVIATDIFVHHYGSVSFKDNGESEYAKRIELNKQKFVNKWGSDPEEIWINGAKPNKKELYFSINKDLFTQHIERSFTNVDENEHQLAIENFEIAISNFKKSNRKGYENLNLDELMVILGNIYFATSNLEKAKETLEAALNENPNSSQACQGLGEIFYSIEEFEAAKTMFEWAVKNDENNEESKQKLMAVNKKLGLDEFDFSLNEE